MNNQLPWFKQKTTWTGIVGIVGAAAGFFTGTLPLAIALQTAFTGLIGVFLRAGVEKAKPQ